MHIFHRDSIRRHCVGDHWPEPLGHVELGESFVVETERFNSVNGPIMVNGVRAGDDLAIHVEAIEIVGPFMACNGGPLIAGPPVELEYRDGWFIWPSHFRLRARPSVGNVAVLPEPTDEIMEMAREIVLPDRRIPHDRGWRRVVNDPRGKHCHQDSSWLTAGSVIHMKAQLAGGGVCVADVHGYIGQGELGFAAIEVAAAVRLRVERSRGWLVDWPMIETYTEIMVCSSYTSSYPNRPAMRFVDVMREAYRSLCEVVAHRIGGNLEDANTIVATAVDLRNCALYGLRGFISDEKSPSDYDIAVVAALPKAVFVERPPVSRPPG